MTFLKNNYGYSMCILYCIFHKKNLKQVKYFFDHIFLICVITDHIVSSFKILLKIIHDGINMYYIYKIQPFLFFGLGYYFDSILLSNRFPDFLISKISCGVMSLDIEKVSKIMIFPCFE
jgi:hypothetical protein